MELWSNIVRGVALGDAWGDPEEFSHVNTITAVNPQGDPMPKHLRITDDTQMTLYLGAALDETWGEEMDVVKTAIENNFIEYYHDPDNNRAPGATVMGSLGRLNKTRDCWLDCTNKGSDGSGTVMRTTPCAFLPEDLWVGVTAFAAALTHGTANGVAAAILNVAVLRALMLGDVRPGGLLQYAKGLCDNAEGLGLCDDAGWLSEGPESLDIDIAEGFEWMGRLIDKILVDLPTLQADPWAKGISSDPSTQGGMDPSHGGGWRAPETIIIAMLALDMLPNDPMLALRRSVVTTGDSDTIGAVAGGLLGAACPTLFLDQWDELRERFETRYVNWIEEEADDYPFDDLEGPVMPFEEPPAPVVRARDLLRRLMSRVR